MLVLGTRNHTPAQRSITSIDRIVIHVTEGTFWGSVRWLRNPRSHGSSHFIVSRKGTVLQMVSTSDVAWHAGNRRVNARSIGIEHEGYSYRRGSITDAEYEASARLVAYLAKRMRIPIDRRHIIAHAEVQDPTNPYKWGGIGHHTDPGPYWDWKRYFNLVRRFAKDPQPLEYVRIFRTPRPAKRARVAAPVERTVRCGYRPSIHSTTVYGGQTVAGLVPWLAAACGRRLHRVDFYVDGKLRWTDRVRPFGFARGRGWNTTTVANGWHTLTLRAHGPRGHRVRKRIRVKVENTLFKAELGGLQPGQAVAGEVSIFARTTAAARQVEIAVDGKVVGRSTTPPFRLAWDSSTVENGEHELEVRGLARDGRRATRSVAFVVANAAEEHGQAPHVSWQSLANWQLVSGPTPWHALVEGDVEQVEFWVNGRLRGVDREEPYAFAGWQREPGLHRLRLRAIGPGGSVTERKLTVFVSSSNPDVSARETP